jgi:CIC family chloride channel protein
LLGAVTLWSVVRTAPERWKHTKIRSLIDARVGRISPECDVTEALRLLLGEHKQHMLLVVSEQGKIQGVVTKADILHSLRTRRVVTQEVTWGTETGRGIR